MVVNASLVAASYDQHGITRFFRHVCSVEDQEYLRHLVVESGCVAFVRDGSVLLRESSTSDLPMLDDPPVPFQSPPGPLRHTFQLIHAGHVTGLLIPKGVTVVCGGWCQGKSTLLQALSVGMYNKVPGDGREFVCTHPTTTMVQSEKGRSVSAVDITPFAPQVGPNGPPTQTFTTGRASGSTSQAAGVMEALEVGATCLLMDEDTGASTFLVRDSRMQQLRGQERATKATRPFLHVVQALRAERGVSSILVGGGCGDYLEVADLVIMMEHYLPKDVTAQAKEIVRRHGGPSLPNNSNSSTANNGGGGGDVGGYTMKVGSGLSLMKVDNSMSGVSGGSGGGSGFQSSMNGSGGGGGYGNGNGNGNGNGSNGGSNGNGNGGGSNGSNGMDDSSNNNGMFSNIRARTLHHTALQVSQERGCTTKVVGRDLTVLQFGAVDIDIAELQFVDVSQVRAVAHILQYIHKHGLCDGERSLAMVLDEIEVVVKARGLDGIACYNNVGDLALPRRAEIAAAINRIQHLKVVVAPDKVYGTNNQQSNTVNRPPIEE